MENFLFSILWSSSHWHFVCIQHILCWKLQNIRNRKLSIPWCILVEKHHGILDLFSNKIIIFIFPYSVSDDFLLGKLKQKFRYFMTSIWLFLWKEKNIGKEYWFHTFFSSSEYHMQFSVVCSLLPFLTISLY